jgi:CelD/BcsL family acetyltransferase involved in cellulose biosynthesis
MPVTGPVCSGGREAVAVAVMLGSARRAFPDLLGLEFAQVTARSALGQLDRPRISEIMNLRHPAGFASFLPTLGSLDDLQKSLSSNFRKRLKKDRKKLNELPDVAFEVYTGREAAPDMLDRFAEVEAAGWKGRGGSAIASSEALLRFYRMLVKRLYRRGCLEWHFLSTGAQTIAGHLAVRSGRTLTLWKIGYNEEFSHCSPGVMLFERAVQNAFERDDVDGFDLVSDKDWHDNWRAEKQPYLDVWLYPRRPLSFLYGVLPKKARWALRRVPGLPALVRRLQGGTGEQ